MDTGVGQNSIPGGPTGHLHGEQPKSGPANDLDDGPFAFWGLNPSEITHLSAEDRLEFERLHQLRSQQREAILALPADETNIQMHRVYECWQQTGMRMKAVQVLSAEDFDAAQYIAGHKVKTYPVLTALYLPEQDVIIVRRDPELERVNGPSIIETSIIHELWHAAARSRGVLPSSDESHRLKWTMGLTRMHNDGTVKGRFLEEGGAVLYESRYASLLPRHERHAPTRYTTLVSNNSGAIEQHFADGMWCAMILEELIIIDPDIDDLLRSTRDGAEQTPELAAHINAILPGLYRQLDAFDPYQHRGNASVFTPFVEAHSKLSFLRLELELESYNQEQHS